MSDRELLEAAAKAFWGSEIDDVVSIEWGEQDESILYTHGENQDHNGQDRTYRWNPLEESHDAFELAVKLGLEVYHSINDGQWTVFVGYPKDQRIVYMMDPYGDDAMAATRRAITRAAAEIGRAEDGRET